MPLKNFALLTFEDRVLLGNRLVPTGSLAWLLREYAGELFPLWLFKGWRGETKQGRNAWPARTLMALLLLRHSEDGATRIGAVRRAGSDATWRSALRLPWSVQPPDEKTVREFEAFLKEDHFDIERSRIELAFEHWTRLCLDAGLLGDDPVWVADSTPMWCFGAVLDTVRLLGDGLRQLGRLWARARKVNLTTVASEWGEPLLLAKSTKGFFEGMDWADADARSAVLTSLVASVNRGVEWVLAHLGEVRQNKRKGLSRRCRHLMRVVSEDLEPTEGGGIRVVTRRSSTRLISATDPEAQHFRKNKSKVCSGFKIHAFGDAVSGLILSLSVTPGGVHDSTELVPLLERAKALQEEIGAVLADTAYSGMNTRNKALKVTGIKVLAPPIRNARKSDGLGKSAVEIDFDAMVATCPGGVRSNSWKWSRSDGAKVPDFGWEEGSEEACTSAAVCPVHKPRKLRNGQLAGAPKRRIRLHADEQGLRAVRAEWNDPNVRSRYRRRAQGERLMREMTRRGARQAGAWGLSNASLQAHAAAAVSNLLVLAKHLAQQESRDRKRAA